MGKLSARAVGEIVAVISVVLSLLFVGLQLRQSTAATQAAAYQELGIATSEMLMTCPADQNYWQIWLWRVETLKA